MKLYVVVEHATKSDDCRVHGLYRRKASALNKKERVESKNKDHGYVAVIKKSVSDMRKRSGR